METRITLGSLFDGIGGWELAAARNGVTPLWSSEIEKFPMQVTKRHFPNVEQLGDINNINGADVEPVGIITAGSPCQDISIAGRREGLAGDRSGLFFQAIRVVREMQEATNGLYPKFFVWENVTGAFSSNRGRDFQTVLETIGQTRIPIPKSGGWAGAGMVRSEKCGIAWRTLDAQFWGVPQHRERVFLVCGFGKWGGYCTVLFEPEGLRRGTSQGTHSRPPTAPPTGGGIENAVIVGNGQGHDPPLRIAHALNTMHDQQIVIYDHNPLDARVKGPLKISPSVTAYLGTGGINGPLVADEGMERVVRRLTPTECEKLQGLPVNWTEGGSDSARYKAIGNGMAQPCADYVMEKVVEAIKKGEGENV